METFQAAARWRLRRGEGVCASLRTGIEGGKRPRREDGRGRPRTLSHGQGSYGSRSARVFANAGPRRGSGAARRLLSLRRGTRPAGPRGAERRASQSAHCRRGMLGFNFVVILLLARTASGGGFFSPDASGASPQGPGFFVMFLLVVLTISTVFGALAGLVFGGLGRLIKEIRGLAGIIVLLCCWAPWVMWLTAFAMDVLVRAVTRSAP